MEWGRPPVSETPEITAVPGRVLGSDIEGQAEALADDAARLAGLLAVFAQESGPRSIDAIAVYRSLSWAAGQTAAAAAALRRQGWPGLEDDAEPEAATGMDGRPGGRVMTDRPGLPGDALTGESQ
jgi:hypothetical protein